MKRVPAYLLSFVDTDRDAFFGVPSLQVASAVSNLKHILRGMNQARGSVHVGGGCINVRIWVAALLLWCPVLSYAEVSSDHGGPNGGSIRPGNDPDACSGTNSGAIRYTSSQLQYCIGTTWTPFATASGTGAADRITSGTQVMSINQNSGNVSLTTGGTTWGYLGSGYSYLPRLQAQDVYISSTANNTLGFNNSGNGQAAMTFNRNANLMWQMGMQTAPTNNFFLYDLASGHDIIQAYPNGPLALMVAGGNVGIGTTAPASALHVNGEAQVGTSGVACAAANNGAIRYVAGDLQYCVGTTWREFASSTGATAAAAGVSGSIQFNSGGALAGRASPYIDANGNILTSATNVFIGNVATGRGYSGLIEGDATYSGFMNFTASGEPNLGYIGYGNQANGLPIVTYRSAPILLMASSTEVMRILPSRRVGINAPAPGAMLEVTNPTGLGSAAGTGTNFLRFSENNGNTSLFDISERRHTAGSNWTGTSMRMQRSIDATPMGFIDFGIDGKSANQGLGFGTSSTTQMALDATGNVGIGTKNPNFNLHVLGGAIGDVRTEGATYAKTSYKTTSSAANNKVWQIFADSTNNTFNLTTLNDAESGGAYALQVQRGTADAINSVSFPNGRVGMGTSSPDSALHVAAGNPVITVSSANTNGWSEIDLKNGRNAADQRNWNIASNGTTSNLDFRALNDARNAGPTVMSLVRTGSVGIGTSDPQTTLDVNGRIRSRDYLESVNGVWNNVYYDNATSTGRYRYNGYAHHFNMRADSDAVNLNMYPQGTANNPLPTGVNAMTWLQNGNVGIGTSSPANNHKLEVSSPYDAVYGISTNSSWSGIVGQNTGGGSAGLLGWGSWGVYCQVGSCGGVNAWTNTSDARLKDRVQTVPDTRGLAMVEKLRPVTFHWKDQARDAKQGQRLGFIAQEVEKLYPELVTTDPSSTMKSLSYAELVVPLTKAVQELKAENDRLKAANDNTQRQLDELRREIRATRH